MLYPGKDRDHALQSIVGCPIHAVQGIRSSPDRQNALECSTSHDLHPLAVWTRDRASKRRIGQFSTVPGLFQTIPDPVITGTAYRTAPAPHMLYSGTAPIRSDDPTPAPRRSRPKSAPSKPLKKCSDAISNTEQMISEKFLIMISQYQNLSIMRTQYQNGPVFGSRTWAGERGRAHGRAGERGRAHIEKLK